MPVLSFLMCSRLAIGAYRLIWIIQEGHKAFYDLSKLRSRLEFCGCNFSGSENFTDWLCLCRWVEVFFDVALVSGP